MHGAAAIAAVFCAVFEKAADRGFSPRFGRVQARLASILRECTIVPTKM
jgi:hypothetical protein